MSKAESDPRGRTGRAITGIPRAVTPRGGERKNPTWICPNCLVPTGWIVLRSEPLPARLHRWGSRPPRPVVVTQRRRACRDCGWLITTHESPFGDDQAALVLAQERLAQRVKAGEFGPSGGSH